jgi:hypothetical protein
VDERRDPGLLRRERRPLEERGAPLHRGEGRPQVVAHDAEDPLLELEHPEPLLGALLAPAHLRARGEPGRDHEREEDDVRCEEDGVGERHAAVPGAALGPELRPLDRLELGADGLDRLGEPAPVARAQFAERPRQAVGVPDLDAAPQLGELRLDEGRERRAPRLLAGDPRTDRVELRVDVRRRPAERVEVLLLPGEQVAALRALGAREGVLEALEREDALRLLRHPRSLPFPVGGHEEVCRHGDQNRADRGEEAGERPRGHGWVTRRAAERFPASSLAENPAGGRRIQRRRLRNEGFGAGAWASAFGGVPALGGGGARTAALEPRVIAGVQG